MKDKIKLLLRENLLLEIDNRQKIIKFSGSPKLADWAHNISNKFSTWIANAVIKKNFNFENPTTERNMIEIVNMLKNQNRPPIDLKGLTYDEVNQYLTYYQYIKDWADNPDTPPVDLRNMTWNDAYQSAHDWHNQLKVGGAVEGITKDAELIKKFDNGYAWYLTKSNYCDVSKKSMGHCASATHNDMYLLRLIKGNEEFVTADWHPKDKYIIQLKGKQNTKPLPKYHPYIEWLLKSDMVKELRTNEGYKPETNFQLTDLPPDKIAELYKTKPSLFNDDQLYNYFNDPNIKPIMMDNMKGETVYKLIKGSPNKMQTAKELGPENLNKLDEFQVFNLLASTTNKEGMANLVGQENVNKLTSPLMLKLFLTNNYIEYTKKLINALGAENIQKLGSYAIRSIIGNSSDVEQAEEIFSQIKNVNVDSVYESVNIKNIIRKKLLLEVDNRQKIIKFTGDPELAEWAHNISDKFSVWIANTVKKENINYKDSYYQETFTEIVNNLLKVTNRPPIDLKDLTLRKADALLSEYGYIMDWVNNPDTPPIDLRNMTWAEAGERAEEWHDNLGVGGEVEGITDGAKMIHKFPDGYAWWLTESNYCEASKDSMGHCATATRNDMYLLRLIKGNEEFLTADWDPKDKEIIQFKGKANDKPIAKYHSYIVWLLKSGMVEDLNTDKGYRPETNFQLTDLSSDDFIDVFKHEPYLFYENDIKDFLTYIGNYFNDQELMDALFKRFDISNIFFGVPESDRFKILNSFIDYANNPKNYNDIYHNNQIETFNDILNRLPYDQAELFQNKINDKHKMDTNPISENMNIKKLLRESLLNKTDNSLTQISDFVNFTKKYLDIKDDIKVALSFERTPDLSTTAYYSLKGFIKVYVKDRAIIDICRSIAHELVHHKQNLDGRLLDATKDGADGSDIENEANAKAGEIIRKYGKLNPEIYN